MFKKKLKKTVMYFMIVLGVYLAIGYLLHLVIFPEKKPDISTYFKPGDVFYSKAENAMQTVVKQENGIVYCEAVIQPFAPGPPVHIHTGFDEVFEVLESEKSDDLFGIFHCFTGDLGQAQRAISLGMKLGIGGVATFKNGKIDQFLNEIDLKNIVLETDSPYLAPVPYRGKRNESSYTLLVAQKLAEIYQLPVEEIAKITTENSKQIFGI